MRKWVLVLRGEEASLLRRVAKGSVVMLLLLVAATPALAWGPGAHAVIGLGVARQLTQPQSVPLVNRYLALQAVYGMAAPDMAQVAPQPLKIVLFAATHDAPGFLAVPKAANLASPVERAFSFGWVTHNQAWGADFYAHIQNPLPSPLAQPQPQPGYVTDRAAVLVALAAQDGLALTDAAAHDYVEAAIDLLLDDQIANRQLALLLWQAAIWRDYRIPWLLARAYAAPLGLDPAVIRAVETGFRSFLAAYGGVLALPSAQRDAAIAAGLAKVHGLTMPQSVGVLAGAKNVCQQPGASYLAAIQATVALVAAGPWP
jgi:hypothetical protein